MYFGVKRRDFEGFLIPVRKPLRQLNFCKFTKKIIWAQGGVQKFVCVVRWSYWFNSDHFSPKKISRGPQKACFSFGHKKVILSKWSILDLHKKISG